MTSIYTSNPISLITTVVLPFHLRPGLPNNLFISDFPNFHVQQAIQRELVVAMNAYRWSGELLAE
jgi:hypothetical protein